MTVTLKPEPLTREAFEPFGDVIEVSDAVQHFTINDGNTERYHDLANIDPGEDGKAIVSIFRGQPRTLPFEVTLMERHPKGSQAFIPTSGYPYLVVVAPAGPEPKPSDLRLFLAQPHQGVNYATGVWHHALFSLDGVADFIVIDRKGPGDNCDFYTMEGTATIPEL